MSRGAAGWGRGAGSVWGVDPRSSGEEPGPGDLELEAAVEDEQGAPQRRPRRTRRRGRRSWGQRLAIALNVFIVLVCLTAALALTRYHEDVQEIDRISATGTLSQVTEPLEPQNFLLVGVDNAEGLDPDDPVRIGRNETSLLSDTIMLLRVDPTENRAWLMSLPRDLWVPIAGSGSRGKINSALALGGPERLIQTIQDDFGIPVHHYVQVNFEGFKEVVDIIDGVPLYFPYPARDRNTGLLVEEPGCVTLEDEQALAFVRSRYYQSQIDGRWVSDPSSDYGRIRRQQAFLRAALDRAIAKGARNPIELQRMIEAAQGQVVLDDQLSLRTLLDIGDRFRDFDPEALEILTLPTEGGMAGAASVVYLQEAEAQPVLEVFRGNNVFDGALALVRVEVRNGTGVAGQGRQVSEDLARTGFTVTRAVDASSFRNPRTTIRYAPGQLVPAVVLARYLDLDVVVEESDEELGDVGVVLVTGDDWTGVRTEPRPVEDFAELLPEGAELPELADPTAPPAPEADAATTTSTSIASHVPEAPEGVSCG